MKRFLGLSATAALLMCGTAQAQTTVKIGVLSDMSSLYADIGGPGSIAAAKLAVADFNANVELLGFWPAEFADQGIVTAAFRQHAAKN